MAEKFVLQELNIYPIGSQAQTIIENLNNTEYGKSPSVRLPQGLIASTLQVTDQDDNQLVFTLTPAKSVDQFLPLQKVTVNSQVQEYQGTLLKMDKQGVHLIINNHYTVIAKPESITSSKIYEIYPLISIFHLSESYQTIYLNYMIKSLYWLINYSISLNKGHLTIRSQARIVNESKDEYSSKTINLYGGGVITAPLEEFQTLAAEPRASRAESVETEGLMLSEDIVKVKEFAGDIPPQEMIMSLDEYKTTYHKYYRHRAGSRGAQVLYQFISPVHLLSGPASLYVGNRYIGSASLAESEPDQLVDLVAGPVNLPISSTVSVVRRFTLTEEIDNQSTTSSAAPTITPQITVQPVIKTSPPAVINNGPSSHNSPGSHNGNKDSTGIEVEEVTIRVKLTNPRRHEIRVILTYYAPGEIIQTNQEVSRWFGRYIEWVPIVFKVTPNPQSSEFKLIQKVPPHLT